MLHFVLWLAYLINSSKAIKVGGKQKPYKMWQAGISLAASPLAKSLAGFVAAPLPRARPLTNPASYAGYHPNQITLLADLLFAPHTCDSKVSLFTCCWLLSMLFVISDTIQINNSFTTQFANVARLQCEYKILS